LDGPAAAAALTHWATAHPRAWAKLRPSLEQTIGEQTELTGASLPLVAFDAVPPEV